MACFQTRAATPLDPPFTRLLLRLRAHPSVTLLLYRVPSLALLAPVLSDNDHRAQWSLSFTCLGSRPSSRPHARAATSHRTSQLRLRSVLRLSHPLDGLLRAHACELVSSRCHVQGSFCSRASLPAPATLPRRKELAPMPLLHRRFARPLPLAQKPARSHVRCLSASRPSSGQGRVPRVRLFTSPAAAPFFSSVSSRSFLLSTSAPFYSARSAPAVTNLGLPLFCSDLAGRCA